MAMKGLRDPRLDAALKAQMGDPSLLVGQQGGPRVIAAINIALLDNGHVAISGTLDERGNCYIMLEMARDAIFKRWLDSTQKNTPDIPPDAAPDAPPAPPGESAAAPGTETAGPAPIPPEVTTGPAAPPGTNTGPDDTTATKLTQP